MSYFNSLNSFRDAQQQIQQHSIDVENQQKDAKANSIQEKFDYVDKVMNESAGGVAGLGGGFHIARKVYKKIKKTKQDAEDAINKAKDLKDKAQGKEGEPDGDKPPDGEEGSEAPKQEMTGDGEDVEGVEGKVKEFQQAETKTQDVPEGGDAKPSEMTKEAPEPPDAAKPTEDFPEAPKPPDEFNADGVRGGDDPRLGTNSSSEVSTEGAKSDLNVKPTEADAKVAGSEADSSSATDSMVDGAAEKAAGGAGKSFVKDAVNSGMEKLGVDDSIKAGVNSGLEVAGEALDFLGPVGEIVGAGIALVGFFRDIFDHKHLMKKEAQAKLGGGIASQSGISMTSLQSAGTQSLQVGTLV
tara:strand:+ start:820 stop:1884 length:1065 start_codon:yes stop_codon:yes gene_type:complete